MFFSNLQSEGLLNLTFKLPSYLSGALFGAILLARFRIGGLREFAAGFLVACVAVWVMQSQGVGFLWWCSVSGVAMVVVSWLYAVLGNNFNPEMTGVVKDETP